MLRLRPVLLATLLLAAPAAAAEGPQERVTNDRKIIDMLARVHDQGASLFNAGDHAGCYRMFQGALVTVKLVLPAELQDLVDRGIGRAELEPAVIRRALMLHELIEEIRKKLHPTAGKAEQLPKPRPAPEGSDPVNPPGVPRPVDKKNDSVRASDDPKLNGTNREPIFSPPEPPRAPAIPPGKINLGNPPPVISGVPTSNPKPAEPMPIDPPKNSISSPAKPPMNPSVPGLMEPPPLPKSAIPPATLNDVPKPAPGLDLPPPPKVDLPAKPKEEPKPAPGLDLPLPKTDPLPVPKSEPPSTPKVDLPPPPKSDPPPAKIDLPPAKIDLPPAPPPGKMELTPQPPTKAPDKPAAPPPMNSAIPLPESKPPAVAPPPASDKPAAPPPAPKDDVPPLPLPESKPPATSPPPPASDKPPEIVVPPPPLNVPPPPAPKKNDDPPPLTVPPVK